MAAAGLPIGSLRPSSNLFCGPDASLETGEGPLCTKLSGNPYLAQGGSGDVLAGYLGGLLAQLGLQNGPLTGIRFAV